MDDTISRQAAIDALGKAPKFKIGLMKRYAEGRNDQWFDDVAALVKLPSAQPKRGKWIGADYDWDIGIYACDQCGRFAMMKSGYCPNCGADMRGEEDEC